MKKARVIEIPENKILDFKNYMKLNDHAYKSALFYATNYNKNSYQIREKLLQKGYIKDSIIVQYNNGNTENHDIIEENIQKLIDQYILDDYQYVLSFIQNGIDAGKSLQSLKNKLFLNKIPKELMDKVLESEELELDESYGLDKEASKIVRSSSFLKLDKYKKQQKLVRTLVGKGFDMGEVYNWINENADIIDEE